MSNFNNLMAEVDYIRKHRPEYGVLEAIIFIREYEEEFPSEVRRELRQFMFDGARMMAPKEAA